MGQADDGTALGANDLLSLTSDIVGAYVANNRINATDLPALILSVHGALGGVGVAAEAAPSVEISKPTAAAIRKSITPDALISFEDGQPYRMLKRHLSKRGLTIAEYKAKWGLPKDYPSTAPSYSAARSEMAKKIGLGQRGGKSTAAKSKAKPTDVPVKHGRGRPKSA